jgi:hypothetical protein
VALLVLVNAAVYGGFVRGEQAVDVAGAERSLIAGLSPSELAERHSGADLPGWFIPSQGRQHVEPGTEVPFCPEGQISNECYATNPPTSGLHLDVARDVVLPDGNVVNIPPDPGIYAFSIPRESIPHIQEHAGVYVGYNCLDAECEDAVFRLHGVVQQELSLGARVVMAPSRDLFPGIVALASWTRLDIIKVPDYSDERVREFIRAHSCRFDPEGFCR